MPIHPTAVIDPRAKVPQSVEIGPHVVIDGAAVLGEDIRLGPSSIILGESHIGPRVQIHAHAVVGDIPQDRGYQGEPSRCIIGADTVIREGCTVHRGTGRDSETIVGKRCYLMSNTHVGHNCSVGNDVTLISGALLGGHVVVGEKAVISGNTGVHQFVRIGTLAMVACVAPITQDVPPFMMTDHLGRVVGVNVIGLRRASYTPTQRAQIKEAYRLLYRTSLTQQDVIEKLAAESLTPPLETLLDFLRQSSSRGIVRGRTRDSQRELPIENNPPSPAGVTQQRVS